SVVTSQRISSDAFSDAATQHATEVESSTVSFGSTVVSVFQISRNTTYGSADIGYATSTNEGLVWTSGVLPNLAKTVDPTSPFDTVSDPVTAFDARHNMWLVASLPIVLAGGSSDAPQIFITRSADGLTWQTPVAAVHVPDSDKEWVACDNNTGSAFYGHCYLEWDNPQDGTIQMALSTDGGATWAQSASVIGNGIGGQIMVQPSGTVTVVSDDGAELSVVAFRSTDGGVTWSHTATVSPIIDHLVANFRAGPLVSASMDAGGTIYATWHDCRFRAGCSSNDAVIVTSSDGSTWTSPVRIPIDPVNSTVDHFIPQIAVDRTTSGAQARIAISYYQYANAACTQSTCSLSANVITSNDGGVSWNTPQALSQPMTLNWIAQTIQGAMVGDYNGITFAGGRPVITFSNAVAPSGLPFDQFFAVPDPSAIPLSTARRLVSRERAIPGVHRDPGPRPRPPR
ncbi:MAG: exo-alpha-sialidase, partial [Candidatus Eremiobacteraeota bacterium]|nr:exo-alpha-sialidase [Candidatus Eremiobacteraeota bacterium]